MLRHDQFYNEEMTDMTYVYIRESFSGRAASRKYRVPKPYVFIINYEINPQPEMTF